MSYSRFAVRCLLTGVVVLAGASAWASGSLNNGTVVPDGTNVWIGAASGGSMSNVANWRAESPKGYTVAELLKMHCVYDLRGLENGAVLVDDLTSGNTYPNERSGYPVNTYALVAGIIASGDPGDTWTITKKGGNGLYFCAPCAITVDGGNLVWDNYAGSMYPYKKPSKYGTGGFWFKTVPTFWESDGFVYAGTLGFTNGADTATYRWKLMNGGAKLAVAGTGISSIAQVYTPSSGLTSDPILEIYPGATLELSTGFNNWNSSYKFYGDVQGSGTLRVAGGATHYLCKNMAEAHAFTGTYQPYLGILSLGASASAPVGVNAASSFDVAGAGWAYLYANTTIAGLTGVGADGGLQYPDDATLTVDGGAATNVFSGRLKGGELVKKGANHTLVLTGENLHSGTKVEAGQLKVRRGFYRPGLRAYWNFDNDDDMGADVSADGIMGVALRNDWNFRPYLVADGVSGKAIHFGNGSEMAKGGLFFRARKEDLSRKSCLPRGSAAFTFSFWMRPTKGKCGNGTNFIHVDSAGSDLTVESGATSAGVNWGNGFYFGSPKYDEASGKSKGLSSLQNLCFYCGCSWTRGGAWNDAGDSKANAQKVAIAKFSNKDYLFDGKWHHVVGTYSNKVMRIFVDGVKMDERTRSADVNVAANPYIQFGNYSSDTAHTYQGDLDEIQWLAGAWSEDEVAAEYAARNPARNKCALLPQPIAHWTFDQQESDKGYKDVTGNGFDLTNVASNGTKYVESEAVTYPGDSSARGAAAKIVAKTSYLKLSKSMTSALPAGSSFTLSMRCGYPVNSTFFVFGDTSANANNVRLGDGGTPRMQSYYVGGSVALKLDDSGCYGSSSTQQQSAYCMNTLVYDAQSKTVRIYRDGVPLVVTNQTFALKAKELQWGRVGNNYFTNLRLDDMRVYAEALTGAQVAELARSMRHGAPSGEIADTSVMPADAVVEVAAGARFATDGANDFVLGQVKGQGEVNIRGGTTLRAADWSGFGGTVTGLGSLLLAEGDTLPTQPITANVIVSSPVLKLADAGKAEPLVKTTGRVVVPQTGTVTVSGAQSAVAIGGCRWAVAEGASFVLPENFAGWTVSPDVPSGKFKFKVVNNALYFVVSGGTTVILR